VGDWWLQLGWVNEGMGDDLGACCQYLWVRIIITSWDLGLRRLQVVLADAEGLLDVA